MLYSIKPTFNKFLLPNSMDFGISPAQTGLVNEQAYDRNQLYPLSFHPAQVSFTSLPAVSYPKEDIAIIQAIIDDTTYIKNFDAILDPQNKFRVQKNNDTVTLFNFEYPVINPKKEAKGVCHELTQHTFKRLLQTFGNKYEFYAVCGKSPRYFNQENSEHMFIVGFPKAKAYDFIFKLNLCTEDRRQKREPKTVPPQVLVIDPSFKVCGVNKGYKIVSPEYDHYNQPFSHQENLRFSLNEEGDYKAFPLGFWEDLIGSDATRIKYFDDVYDNPLVYQKFYKDYDGTIKFSLSIQEKPNSKLIGMKFWKNLFHELPNQSSFKKYIMRMNDEFNKD